MNSEYCQLAERRATTTWEPYLQPEDFGYDFREWVSPYTKGSHAMGGIALVLQDWASADGLKGGPIPDVQEFGRTRGLLTNKRLEETLRRVFGLTIDEVYTTNAFPFVKPGGMSSNIPLSHIVRTVREFTAKEIQIAKPTTLIALGSVTSRALDRAGLNAYHVPHPAARGLSADDHERLWRKALCV